MSLGKKLIDWDSSDITRGMTTSSETFDGGFSIETDGVNLVNTPGVAYIPSAPTDASTNVADLIIASCDDASGTYDRVFLGNGGKFYGWNGTIQALVATDSTRSYTAGKTDMSSFGPYVYGTSTTHVFEWQVPSATINQTYFAFSGSSGSASWASGSVPHPCLAFEGSIYYGNGPQLLRQTIVGGTPTEILLLSNYGETIQTLGIDPGSGKMLISTTSGLNASDSLNKVDRVIYYDGFSQKTIKTVIVDEMVTAFYPNGGNIYIGYGQNLGYWSGAGIQFLRKLANITFSSDDLLYKHHFTNIGSSLYVVDGAQILVHGPITQGGNKVFYYCYKNQPSGITKKLSNIANLGKNIIGIAYATNQFFTFDVQSISTLGNQSISSIKYPFPNPVWISRVKIWFKSGIAANVEPGVLLLYDGGPNPLPGGNAGSYTLRNITTATVYTKEIDNINAKTDIVQFNLLLGTVQSGIKRVVIYGYPADVT